MDSRVIKEPKKILGSYNIEPSPRRMEILKIILDIKGREFTIGEIDLLLKKINPSASISVVANTLILFKNTKLISEIDPLPKSTGRIGRPKTKFILEPDLQRAVYQSTECLLSME